jgi:hypothetical protein
LRWATVIFLSLKIDVATAADCALGFGTATGDALTVVFRGRGDRVTGLGAGLATGFGLGVGTTGLAGETAGGLAMGAGLGGGGWMAGGVVVVGGALSCVMTWSRDGIGAALVEMKD